MKKIVIGIDISKEKIDVSAIDVRNIQHGVQKLDYQTFENRPMGFRRMLVWARPTSTPRTWTSGVKVRFRSSAAWACARVRMTRPTH